MYDLADGTAEVGYRVARQVANRGVATASQRELCWVARVHYGLRMVTARMTVAKAKARRSPGVGWRCAIVRPGQILAKARSGPHILDRAGRSAGSDQTQLRTN